MHKLIYVLYKLHKKIDLKTYKWLKIIKIQRKNWIYQKMHYCKCIFLLVNFENTLIIDEHKFHGQTEKWIIFWRLAKSTINRKIDKFMDMTSYVSTIGHCFLFILDHLIEWITNCDNSKLFFDSYIFDV